MEKIPMSAGWLIGWSLTTASFNPLLPEKAFPSNFEI